MEINANLSRIQQQLDGAPWGQRSLIVSQHASRFDCSKATFYRKLRQHRGSNRKEIERPKRVDPDNFLCRKIMKLKIYGQSLHLKEREVSTEWCIQELIRNGFEEAKN